MESKGSGVVGNLTEERGLELVYVEHPSLIVSLLDKRRPTRAAVQLAIQQVVQS
jgi:hypothetical protein